MTPQIVVAALLCAIALVAALRLGLWRRRAAVEERSSIYRFAALLALQPITCGLLYCALFPPFRGGEATALRVATAAAPATLVADGGSPLISLPEAGLSIGEQAPDLATALRRHPGVRTIEVVGAGLTPRDIEAARKVGVRFARPAQPPGILSITPPHRVAPGASFTVGGTVVAQRGVSVELLDPAGRATDRTAPCAGGSFQLQGTARSAGSARFNLRLRTGGRVIETAIVPIWVDDATRPKLLILAGAPNAEAKFLRRWATDAGYDVTTRISAGGGVVLGDGPVALTPGALAAYDAAIVDDRAWETARAALLAATRDGMGLVLHPGGPIDAATLGQWRALGFGLAGANRQTPLALPPAAHPAIARTRMGPPSEGASAELDMHTDAPPELGRLDLSPGGRDTVRLVDGAGGTGLAAWRQVGQGRVALFTATDSYGLILTGRRDLHNDWWSAMVSAVARPSIVAEMDTRLLWRDERVTLCGVSVNARIRAADGRSTTPQVVGTCAAFWPSSIGFHRLEDGPRSRIFYVRSASELRAARRSRDGDATMLLSSSTRWPERVAAAAIHPWFWWMAWFGASVLLWWLERSRFGRAQSAR